MIRSRPCRRGTQALEFALVMPLLLALLTGVVDFGWYYDRSMAVIAAAREGARNGATHASTAGGNPCVDAETRTVNSLVSAGFAATASHVTGSVANDPALGDRLLTVQAQLPQTKLFGLVPSPATISERVVIRLEDQSNTACSF